MSLLHALELEERVGGLWHRLVGDKASWPHHHAAEIRLDAVRAPLAVFFRGLGGDRGLQITAASARESDHRLNWRQRIGMERERLVTARRDEVCLALPDGIAFFAEPDLNRDLYFWLAAYFTVLEPAAAVLADPLLADLAALERARRTTSAALEQCPGLAGRHARLAAALLAARPRRQLTGVEQTVEELVAGTLAGTAAPHESRPAAAAPRGYRPFLPVPDDAYWDFRRATALGSHGASFSARDVVDAATWAAHQRVVR